MKLPRTWDDVPRRSHHLLSAPKPAREQSNGGGVDSDSNLDFLRSLATSVDTIVWATVDSGAATSCLSKELCKNLDLAVKPVDANASGQPVPVHGTCSPMVTIGEKGGPPQRSGSVLSNGCGEAIAVSVQAG